jgi:hypothetical protein
MRRAAVIRLALAAMAGLGLNLALFQAFARLLGAALLVGARIAVQVAHALSRPGRPHPLVRIAVSLGSIGEQQRRG